MGRLRKIGGGKDFGYGGDMGAGAVFSLSGSFSYNDGMAHP